MLGGNGAERTVDRPVPVLKTWMTPALRGSSLAAFQVQRTAGLAWPCDTPRLPTSVPKQTREHVECVLKEPRRPLAPLDP